MVYNGYYKVMSNIPKMGHLPTPEKLQESPIFNGKIYENLWFPVKMFPEKPIHWRKETIGTWWLFAKKRVDLVDFMGCLMIFLGQIDDS